MENNAVIRIRFSDMLGILEAREFVSVYIQGEDKPIRKAEYVYETLADKDFMKQYGDFFVRGLISFPIQTNILIAKEMN